MHSTAGKAVRQVGPYTVWHRDDGEFDVLSTLTNCLVYGPCSNADDAIGIADLYARMLSRESKDRRRQRGATRLY